jgi:predicted RNA-binding Zn ribbon-like protein
MNRNDIDLLASLVWYLNVRITSARQVETRFARIVKSQNKHFAMPPLTTAPTWGSRAADEDAPRMTDAQALGYYQDQQAAAREVALQVIAYDKKTAAERGLILDAVAKQLLSEVRAGLGVSFSARKGLVLDLHAMLTTVTAAATYGFALLLGDKNLRRRIGLCAHEGCSMFFFDTRLHGGGQQRYCSQAHSDLDRVARWRLKKSLERKS